MDKHALVNLSRRECFIVRNLLYRAFVEAQPIIQPVFRPLALAIGVIVFYDSVCDLPVCDDDSHNEVGELHSHHATTRLWHSAFCEPNRDDCRHDSKPESSDESSNKELSNAERR